ncbi:Hypothetical predicted protein [Octopus vulgaris]|uniref:Reverse transcriptase domain-containing protein n=1 Tax=Octopus vulgaris TaxID=6645 RepID=A0AA36B3Y7_OCTVU|nr:Hypothetical predicted protein [Octopus vulgaris]
MCFINYSKTSGYIDHDKLWKCLEKMGTPLHLVQLIRSLYQNQEATVRTSYGDTGWFEIGKGTRQGCILSPAAFNMYTEKVMRNAGLEDSSIGVRIRGRNINNRRYADDTTLLAESEHCNLYHFPAPSTSYNAHAIAVAAGDVVIIGGADCDVGDCGGRSCDFVFAAAC